MNKTLIHSMKEEKDTKFHMSYNEERNDNLLYYGLLIYTMIFYSQFAGRFPVFKPFRLELVLGVILVFSSLLKMINKEIDFAENRMNFAAFSFIFVAVITIPFAYVKSRTLEVVIELFKFFSIYLMIISSLTSERKLKGFIYIYIGMITLLFIQPFFLSLQGKGFIYNNGMMRLAGVTNYFGHPNHLGGITAANLPFFYYLMKSSKSVVSKIIFLLLIIIALRVIMLTQSRTAFVGVMTFGVLVWLLGRKKIISLISIIICCIVIWQFAPQETKNRFLTLGNATHVISGEMGHKEAGSMYSRWVLIKRGFIAFKENPILGLGPGGYISFNGNRWNYWFPPHNTYIQALSEMGMVGFSVFIYVIILTFKNLHYSYNIMKEIKERDSFIANITLALTAYLSVQMMVSMFGQDLYDNNWWVAAGLSLVMFRLTKLKYHQYNREQIKNSVPLSTAD